MPTYVFRLGRAVFADALGMCEGDQIAKVVAAIGDIRPDLRWYASDAQGVGPTFVGELVPIPELVGDARALASAARSVSQFESGVFVGVEPACVHPRFRQGGMWTEDEEVADLGDAIVEIRAFDTTYISISASDPRIAAHVKKCFVGVQEVFSP